MRAIVERASSYPRYRWLKSPPLLRGGSVELEAGREGNSKRKLVKTVVSVVVVESAQPLIRRECDVQLGGGGNLFAEIRLREIRCEVEVGRGSCALFAKAKVDARERLEFTEGSTPRERCLSVTTADTRECLEILVFLFLVTLSLSLFPFPSLPSSLITLLGPQGILLSSLLYILRRYTNFRGTSSERKEKHESRRESDPFLFRSWCRKGKHGKERYWIYLLHLFVRLVRKLFSIPNALGFRNILILREDD